MKKLNITEKEFMDAVQEYRYPKNMQNNDPALYMHAQYKGWLKKANWPERKTRYGLNIEQLEKEIFDHSRECGSRGEFKDKYPADYSIALRRKWLNKMIWLKPKPNIWTDRIYYVYAYFFVEQKCCYIGLTHHGSYRDWSHRNDHKSQVFKFAEKNGIDIPKPTIIENKLTHKNIQEREDFWKKYYISSGWSILNVGKTGKCIGSLGYTKVFWTRKRCYNAAKKCSEAEELKKNFPSAWSAARKNGWLVDYHWFCDQRKIPIAQYTLDGQFIKRWKCVGDAIGALGLKKTAQANISACCRGKRNVAYGYTWKYEKGVLSA